MEQKISEIYSQETLEFVTVSTQYCIFLEQAEGRERKDFVDTLRKLLPLLYLKSSLLNVPSSEEPLLLEEQVTEADYEAVRQTAARIMGEQDDYLDVFVEDMKYSDEPIKKNISEDLADIYQDLRNFVGIYKEGLDEVMQASLSEVIEAFRLRWGQIAVNTLRALHDVQFGQGVAENEEEL